MSIKTAWWISISLVIIGVSLGFATPIIYSYNIHAPITISYVLSFPTVIIGLIIDTIGVIGMYLVKCFNIKWKQ